MGFRHCIHHRRYDEAARASILEYDANGKEDSLEHLDVTESMLVALQLPATHRHLANLSSLISTGPSRLHGLCRRAGLDQQHASPATGQAGRGARFHQRRQQLQQHLCQLHVSQERRAAVRGRVCGQLLHVIHRHLRGDGAEIHAGAAQQEARCGNLCRRGYQCSAGRGGGAWVQVQGVDLEATPGACAGVQSVVWRYHGISLRRSW